MLAKSERRMALGTIKLFNSIYLVIVIILLCLFYFDRGCPRVRFSLFVGRCFDAPSSSSTRHSRRETSIVSFEKAYNQLRKIWVRAFYNIKLIKSQSIKDQARVDSALCSTRCGPMLFSKDAATEPFTDATATKLVVLFLFH